MFAINGLAAWATKMNGLGTRLAMCAGLVLFMAVSSFATIYTYTPNPADLNGLDHSYYYTWGMNRTWSDSEVVTGATLHFENIRNWDNNANVLYVHLLDDPKKGIVTKTDNEGGGDAFSGQGVVLGTYRNLTTTARDIDIVLSASQLASLTSYADAKTFGFGFDPDCHYYNDGVSLTVETSSVPEPTTMGVLMSAAGAFGLKRRMQALSL